MNHATLSSRILCPVLIAFLLSSTSTADIKADDAGQFGDGDHNDLRSLLRHRRDGGGGSYGEWGSHEGGVYQSMSTDMNQVLLQAILAAATAEAAAPVAAPAVVPADAAATGGQSALPAPAPASGLANPLTLALIANLMSQQNQQPAYYPPPYYGGGGDDDPQAASHSVIQGPAPSYDPCEAAKVCNNLPFSSIVQFRDNLLAFQEDRVYEIRPDGSFVSTVPRRVQNLFPGFNGPKDITAAVNFNSSLCLFHGDEYTEYSGSELPAKPQKANKISSGFPGVTTPVHSAFQLDTDTYIFVSYHTFEKYNASAKPPVDPETNPQFLSAISLDLKRVDSAFSLKNGQRFILSRGIMYEVDRNLKVISRKPERTVEEKDGWLKCPTLDQQKACSSSAKDSSGNVDSLSTSTGQKV